MVGPIIIGAVSDFFSYRAAFGLIVTIIWLYMEVLRVLSILRGND